MSDPLTILVPRETTPGETRVAASVDSVRRLVKLRFSVVIEADAGRAAGLTDADLEAAGATVGPVDAGTYGSADLGVKLNPPESRDDLGGSEAGLMKEGAVLVSFLWPAARLDDGPNRVNGRCIEYDVEADVFRVEDATINIVPEDDEPAPAATP